MKRAEKYIYLVLGIILIVVIACSITYIVATNNNKTETKEEPNNNQEENNNKDEQVLKDSVTLKNTYQEGNNIIQEYEIILNNKVNNITIKYTHENTFVYTADAHAITGVFNNKDIIKNYYVNTSYQVNTFGEYTKENTFNVSSINQLFNEDNFIIIKGTDNKSYLLVQTINNMADNFNTSNLYVYNDELELISRNMITEEESPDYTSYDGFIIDNFIGNIPCDYVGNSPLYERTFKVVDNANEIDKQYTKIENNQIYFLFPKINDGILEERVYTINNNKLEYTIINTYKFNSVCQEI